MVLKGDHQALPHHCLQQPCLKLSLTVIGSLDLNIPIDIPEEYYEFKDTLVQLKQVTNPLIARTIVQSTSCSTTPCSWMYLLSFIEKQKKQPEHIVPFTSPALAGFFFVARKKGGQRLYTIYRELNQSTVPLLTSTCAFSPGTTLIHTYLYVARVQGVQFDIHLCGW